MASETAQRHVTEIVERDTIEMEPLLQTDDLKDVPNRAKYGANFHPFVRLMGTLSDSWTIFDFDVFSVRFFTSICSDIVTVFTTFILVKSKMLKMRSSPGCRVV